MPQRFKLLASYSVFLLFAGLMSWLVYREQLAVHAGISHLGQRQLPKVNVIRELHSALAEHERLLYELYATTESKQLEPALQSVRTRFAAAITLLETGPLQDPMARPLLEHYRQIIAIAGNLEHNLANRSVDWDLARDDLIKLTEQGDQVRPLLANASVQIVQLAHQNSLTAQARTQYSSQLVIGFSLCMLGLAAFLGFYIDRYLADNRARKRLAMFAERNPNPVLSLDQQGKVYFSNPASQDMLKTLGHAAAAPDALLPDDINRYLNLLRASSQESLRWQSNNDGTTFKFHLHKLADLGCFHLYIEDITREALALQQLRDQANHDWLTQLPNRRQFLSDVEAATLQHTRFAVAVLRLDRFGLITASQGFDVGDALIIALAENLRDWLQMVPKGAQLYRFEGTTLALTLADIDTPEAASDCAQRLRRAMDKPFHVQGRQFYLSFSIGLSLCPEHGHDARELVRRADTALNRVKLQGGNGELCFNDAMQQSERHWLDLLNELKVAVAQQHFSLYYQPKISVRDNRSASAEALIRWLHPHKKMISPAEFIPVAEQSGLIIDIGDWVIGEAFRQQQRWAADNVHIAINLSARQFQQQDFMNRIDYWLAETGAAPNLIEMEITESLIMENLERALYIMGQLKQRGFSLAIDDFGTGYSSLSHLKAFPINTLKIDRAFIMTIDSQEQDRMIAQSIIDLAHNLQLQVVAEGVETEAQYRLLVDMGCDVIQGFLFSRPLPAIEFLDHWQSLQQNTASSDEMCK